jgi:hypothetical protein
MMTRLTTIATCLCLTAETFLTLNLMWIPHDCRMRERA